MEEILRKIKEEKDKKIKEIEEKFLEQKKKLEEEAKKEIEEFKKEREEFYRREGERKKIAVISSARIEAKKNILREKRKILDEVFNEFFEKFLALEDDKYFKFIEKFIKEIPEKGEFYLAKNEREKTKDFILKKHKNLTFKGKTDDFDYGIKIFSGEINHIFDFREILKEYFKNREKEIAEKLWK